jgi:hypothetical protein
LRIVVTSCTGGSDGATIKVDREHHATRPQRAG